MSEPKVTNPPKRIWLNFGEIEEDVDFDTLRDWECITWCDIAQDDADIAYVLASDLAAAVARAERAESDLRAALSTPERPCTCHPDDNPPVPCAKKYALSECKETPEPSREPKS